MAIEQTAEYWLSYGARYLQQARWREAENCYRQALEIRPNQPVVLGRLAMLALREKRISEAEKFLRQSIKLDNDNHESFVGLGLVLDEQGRFDESVEKYRKARSLAPENVEIKFHLGSALTKAHKLDDAIGVFADILSSYPDHVAASDALGHLYLATGQVENAIKFFRDVVDIQHQQAPAHYQLALTLNSSGNSDSAIASYRQALAIDPNFSKAYVNLGNIYSRRKNYADAIDCYSHAIRIDPSLIHACYNLAKALFELNRFEESAAYFLKTLELRPETHPNVLEVLDQLGTALKNSQQLDDAEHYLLEALKIAPEAVSPLINLALTYSEQGRVDEAIALFQQALENTPHDSATRSDYLLTLNYSSMAPRELLAEHMKWEASLISSNDRPLQFDGDRSPFRRLRIGWVSPDFRSHSVWYFITHLFHHYDKTQFEFIAYSNVPAHQEDEITEEIKTLTDTWREIHSLSDEEAAKLIHQDKIDILVDLAGHTGNNRLGVFTLKPAPIQVTYLGYPNTTGVSTLDYRLTDECADPADSANSHAIEKLVRLPQGFLCYQPDTEAPAISPLPASANGFVTFGSFNNAAKITSTSIDLWTQILARTPGSKLVLKHRAFSDGGVKARYIKLFSKNGIDEERLDFRGWLASSNHHLALYHQIDIALDPVLYNGATTTCEALWMGVPVVTLTGDRHAARVGNSILAHAGFDHLITPNGDAYIELATKLANDLPQLETFRATARERLAKSALLNAEMHTRNLEQAFRGMWRQWCEVF